MYQLEKTWNENSENSLSDGGEKNLKHIIVYTCAGDWISYTAGSMPFMSKATKKCNNGVDHSLHLVSCLLCDLKTIYRVQIYVRTLSNKENTNRKQKQI